MAATFEASVALFLSVGGWVLVKYSITKQDKGYVRSITGHGETAARAVHFLKLKSRNRPTSSWLNDHVIVDCTFFCLRQLGLAFFV